MIWYYAFAVALGFAVMDLVVIIKQRIELRDLRMVAKAFVAKLDQEDTADEG